MLGISSGLHALKGDNLLIWHEIFSGVMSGGGESGSGYSWFSGTLEQSGFLGKNICASTFTLPSLVLISCRRPSSPSVGILSVGMHILPPSPVSSLR